MSGSTYKSGPGHSLFPLSGKALIVLFICLLPASMAGQDTLRTYGPRFGFDLSRIAYLFTDPVQKGAEVSLDFEVYKNIYPVFELGFNHSTDPGELYSYKSGGPYARIGMDYNLLPMDDRSVHHTITAGFRYAVSVFDHEAEDISIQGDYWGDYYLDTYENRLSGHWFEIVGGMKTEIGANFFLGWSLRLKILMNPDMDPVLPPQMIPGYGNGSESRAFGFNYSIMYKIPLIKR